MNTRGRPKTSRLTRAEQLRRAKRAQRARDHSAGIVQVQLAVPRRVADKLGVVRRSSDIGAELDRWLDRYVVRPADYPALADISWNLAQEYIPAKEALALYERNWRFIDRKRLDDRERRLIERLVEQFGGGILHA